MLSIMRRRVSSGDLSSLILGQSFRGVRPAISTPRIFATSGDEVIHNSRGFGNVRNLCHLIFPGYSPSLRPIRSSLAPLLLRVKNVVCVEIKSCPKIFPVRSLHTIPTPRVSLLDYHKKHEENFFIIASTHPKTYIGPSPLCQQILRELISSTYNLKKLNKPFVPKLSDIYLNFGDIGLVSITLDSCGSDPGKYIDPLVGNCSEVMSVLLKSRKLVELHDLRDVACHSKWWGDVDDIFLHPFFMTPQMHQAFVTNMNILAYIPNVAGDMDTMVKRQSLKKLAVELRKSWIWRAARRNETWVDQCTFVVPEVWKEAHDDKMTLLRSLRNFLHHPCDDAQFFQTAAQWDHRLDHFILIMNSSHNISATLFHAFWRLKQQFEKTHVNPGTDMVMWKTALSSVLPIDQRISDVAVQTVQQPSV